jgi:putative hydrolase of the HAD superfamily
MVEVVTFDAAGTLIETSRSIGEIYAEVAAASGAALDPVRLQAGFRAAWKELDPPAEVAGPRLDDDRDWWKKMVRLTFQHAGAQVQDFERYFDRLYDHFTSPGIWVLLPRVAQTLAELEGRRVRLGVISNFDRRLYPILDHLGVLNRFEHVVISSESGADKPSPRIFQDAARRFEVSPNRILHVGDDELADGEGARRAGFQSLVVDDGISRVVGVLERVG